MFGGVIIPLYNNHNVFLEDDREKIFEIIQQEKAVARKADGFEDTIIGTLIVDSKRVILHDKNKVLEQLEEEYKNDPDFSGDNHYLMALEFYDYNIIGSYVDGVPAYATIDEDLL